MTYSEIYDAVAQITNKPDLVGDITTAIQRSTLKMHALEYWKFDLVEDNMVAPAQAFKMQIPRSTFPNFRQICYLRAYDLSADLLGPYYKPADANELIDSYGRAIINRYYTAGTNINILAAAITPNIAYGYYTRPIISPTSSYNSWIGAEYPFAIIDDAANMIFKSIGMDDKVRKFDMIVAEHLQYLKTSYLEDQSR